MIATDLIYDSKPSHRKFQREVLKIGIRKPFGRKPRWMGDIEAGVSHFLCPDHDVWLFSQRYEVSLEDKRLIKRELADKWRIGLMNGTYRNRADIARQNECSRAWITRVLSQFPSI